MTFSRTFLVGTLLICFISIVASDEVSEVSRKSWGDRISDSLTAFVIGWCLFIFAFPFLTYNEGSYVHREKCLNYAKKLISNKKDEEAPCLDKGLAYASGMVTSLEEQIVDTDFGVTSKQALKLDRKVEMYQYYEESHSKTKKDTVGGGETTKTTYTKKKGWFSYHQSLIHFKETNPQMLYLSKNFQTPLVIDDIYKLSTSQTNRVYCSEAVELSENLPHEIDHKLAASLNATHGGSKKSFKVVGNELHFSSGSYDEIGDLRISWKFAEPNVYSLLAQHTGDTFKEFEVTEFGHYTVPSLCCGCCPWTAILNSCAHSTTDIDLFEKGHHTGTDLLNHAMQSNTLWHRIFQLVGFLLMTVGIFCILDPIATIVDVIGFLGSIMRYGEWLLALVLGFIFTVLTIAFAWLFYHPLKAVIMILAGGLIVFGIEYLTSL